MYFFKKNVVYLSVERPLPLLGKGVLKICSEFTGEHPCRSAISRKLKSHFGMGVL